MQNSNKFNWYSLLNEVRHQVEFITKNEQRPTWKCNLIQQHQYNQEKDTSNLCETAAEKTVRRFWIILVYIVKLLT